MGLRLIKRAYSCSTVQGAGELKVRCSSLPLTLGWGVLAAKTRHFAGVCLRLQRSRYEAPTDQASLQLLHVARRRRTQGACSSLRLALGRRALCRRKQTNSMCVLVFASRT